MIAVVAKIAIACAAMGLIWQGWENVGLLRGTWFNDVRLVLFAAAAILVLSAAEWLSARVTRILGGSVG